MMCGCGRENVLLHRYTHLSGNVWNCRDTLSFDFPASPVSAIYDLSLALRLGYKYPYSTLRVVVDQQFEEPQYQAKDTVLLELADSLGMLKGDGVSMLQNEFSVLSVPLQSGQYGRLRIYHIMPRETVGSIRDVGVKLSR